MLISKKAVEETLAWRRAASGESENKPLPRRFSFGGGEFGADWYAVAVGRFGLADDYAAYLSALRSNVEARYSTPGKLNAQKATGGIGYLLRSHLSAAIRQASAPTRTETRSTSLRTERISAPAPPISAYRG